MPTISYRITFHHQDGTPYEEQFFNDAHDAWQAFRLFAEPDSSEMYTSIELTEVNFEEHHDHTLAVLEFPA